LSQDFNDAQHQATKDAGMIPGLNSLCIINESTAAASLVDLSAASMSCHKFMLIDPALKSPKMQLSLVCGQLGSGKTLSSLGTSYGANLGMLLNVIQLYSVG
jgi:hypothetical protein